MTDTVQPPQAAIYDLTIEQGTTWTLSLLWKTSAGATVDLTGYTARMQVRHRIGDPDPPLLNLTSENGGITLGGAAGTLALVATPTQTDALSTRTGVYDLEVQSPTGVVTRLLQGCVSISPEVTR